MKAGTRCPKFYLHTYTGYHCPIELIRGEDSCETSESKGVNAKMSVIELGLTLERPVNVASGNEKALPGPHVVLITIAEVSYQGDIFQIERAFVAEYGHELG